MTWDGALFNRFESNVAGWLVLNSVVWWHFKQAGRRLSALDVGEPVSSFSHPGIVRLAHHQNFQIG